MIGVRVYRIAVAACLLGVSLISCVPAYVEEARKESIKSAMKINVQNVRDRDQAAAAVTKIIAYKGGNVPETGTGIFISYRQGIAYILTAYHVVEGLDVRIAVEFKAFPGKRFAAELLSPADEKADIAVIIVRHPDIEIYRLVTFGTGVYTELKETPQRLGITYRLKEDANRAGIFITDVISGSQADAVGLQKNDLILTVNQKKLQPEEFKELANRLPIGSKIDLTLERKRVQYTATLFIQSGRGPVFSIGHPAGGNWVWNNGFVKGAFDEGRLLLSNGLCPKHSSGGPIFDARYKIIGMCTGETSKFKGDTALDIRKAFNFLDANRVPYRYWSRPDFCANLLTVVEQEKSGFKELKNGVAKNDKYGLRWPAKIDLLGTSKSYIEYRYSDHKEPQRGGYTSYISSMDASTYEEGDYLTRELVRQILSCVSRPFDVEEGKEYCSRVFWKDVGEDLRGIDVCRYFHRVTIEAGYHHIGVPE